MSAYKWIMIIICICNIGCEYQEGGRQGGGVEGEGEGEGQEGEGEHPCSAGECEEGFVCMDGTCIPEGQEGGNECQQDQTQCVGNAAQSCGANGYWEPLVDCGNDATCVNGNCVPNNPPDTDTCEVWIDNGQICGNIVGLSAWTFGCMPPGVEPVCELQTGNGVCVQIMDGVDSAWPRKSDGGWLTVVGCEVRDGLRIISDPSGGHYIKLP